MTRGAPAESRTEEWRQMEPPGDDEPLPDARIAGDTFPDEGDLDLDEIEDRSLLAISLRPSAFPATAVVLLDVAREQHAEPRVMSWLERLDPDVTFRNVEDVWEALGGRREERQHRPAAAGTGTDQRASAREPRAPSPSLPSRAVGLGKAAVEVAVGCVITAATNVAQRLRGLVR